MAIPAPALNLRTLLSSVTLQQKIVPAGAGIVLLAMVLGAVYFTNHIDYFQEQVNEQGALEAELARSIMTLADVQAARVHLMLAEDQAKASVILKLKSGRSLSGDA